MYDFDVHIQVMRDLPCWNRCPTLLITKPSPLHKSLNTDSFCASWSTAPNTVFVWFMANDVEFCRVRRAACELMDSLKYPGLVESDEFSSAWVMRSTAFLTIDCVGTIRRRRVSSR